MTDKKKIKINTEAEKADQDQSTPESDSAFAAEQSAEDDQQAPNEFESAADPAEEMNRKLEIAEKEAKDNYERFLRISADFENYKKRSSREMSEFKKYANESLLKELLAVVDNLELAIKSSSEDNHANESVVEGVDMTLKEMLRILGKFGVEPIDSLGKVFDPTYHQAMLQEETESQPQNTILKEFQKGYIMHGRLLRPAMVVVSKAKAKDDNTENNGRESG
jgi:molecular chaperone GrpE